MITNNKKFIVSMLAILYIATAFGTVANAGLTGSSATPTLTPPTVKYLVIHAPTHVDENHTFAIQVTTRVGVPVLQAAVEIGWDKRIYYTDMNGTVILTAPYVDHNMTFSIIASKKGYISDTEYITVLDTGK